MVAVEHRVLQKIALTLKLAGYCRKSGLNRLVYTGDIFNIITVSKYAPELADVFARGFLVDADAQATVSTVVFEAVAQPGPTWE